MFREFEATFEFEETPDQLSAIEAVKQADILVPTVTDRIDAAVLSQDLLNQNLILLENRPTLGSLGKTFSRAGRAGRRERQGEVLIQTHHPDHPLLQTLLHSGYQAFAMAALQERQAAGLPPSRHLVLLRCESVEIRAAQTFLQEAADCARQVDLNDIELFGPIPAPMERRADGRWRFGSGRDRATGSRARTVTATRDAGEIAVAANPKSKSLSN